MGSVVDGFQSGRAGRRGGNHRRQNQTEKYCFYDSGVLKRQTDSQGPTIIYDVDSQNRVVGQRVVHGSIVQTTEWNLGAATGLPVFAFPKEREFFVELRLPPLLDEVPA